MNGAVRTLPKSLTLTNFKWTYLRSQEDLWELPIHAGIRIMLVMKLVGRTAGVRRSRSAYSAIHS